MSLLSELSAIAKKLKIPAQTSVYSGKAPDEYLVFTPLYDSFELLPTMRRLPMCRKCGFLFSAKETTPALQAGW